ncbi:hypothetical protein [Azospirillum griseum]|uniref:Uncharacterized protein n=1 Tax=Azospirillum griseum TaxID=2496639 RepID=A0A431VAN5_9PROT|nr:hypothetical protein [Azospirillum griseum]RTR14253.1 hypothetical protein EJ903_23880 [Azospirillum griseum]
MTESQFLRHLAEFGADPTRWPPELRAGAETALATDPTLRAAQQREAAFDRRLTGAPPDIDDARLARLLARVGQAARATPQETLMVLLLGRMPRWTAAALCMALLTLGWQAGHRLTAPTNQPRGAEVALLSDDVTTLFDGDTR